MNIGHLPSNLELCYLNRLASKRTTAGEGCRILQDIFMEGDHIFQYPASQYVLADLKWQLIYFLSILRYVPVLVKNLGGHYFFFFISFLKLLLHWGYIVTFTKVLILCRSWIHPLNHSPLSLHSHSWDSLNRTHCSIFIHEYIRFPPYNLLHPFLVSPPYTGANLQKGPVWSSCSPFWFV
jgi:hypothetical protein